MTAETSCEQTRDEYLSRVAALFKRAREWTSEFDAEAKITEESITIKEEPGAPYEAKVLVINRPNYKTVRLIPRGRWIIGAEGRVDMKSDLGTETLVYSSVGGPVIQIELLTESGKPFLEEISHPFGNNVAEGWVFLQNRQLGMRPSLNAFLFRQLLKVLGQ